MKKLDIKTALMGKGLRVSTVVIGEERANSVGFSHETKVFHRSTGWMSWDSEEYSSELAARKGHRAMVSKWKAKSRKEIRELLAKMRKT